MFMKPIVTFLALYLSAATFLTACSKENAYQDDANQQNNLESQQKTQELDQVTGTYKGPMLLTNYDRPLQVVIYLNVNQGTASQPDQINKIQVPMLGGNLTFPALQNEGSLAAMAAFPDIVRAMGSTLSISFTNGDFNSNSSTITLPYNSGGTASGNDQVIGTFQNGVFSGEWDSHTGGKMGTFSLERSDS
jgi:hypothetical protein